MIRLSFMKQVFFVGLIVGMFSPVFLYAQTEEGGGLSVTPAFQEVVLNEEKTEIRFPVTLTNRSSRDYLLTLSVLDFGSLDETGGVAFLGAEKDLEKKYGPITK